RPRRPPPSPYTTLFRSGGLAPDVRAPASTEASAERGRPGGDRADLLAAAREALPHDPAYVRALDVVKRASDARGVFAAAGLKLPDRKSTRLNSSHLVIS